MLKYSKKTGMSTPEREHCTHRRQYTAAQSNRECVRKATA
jgi:hypothetical protein